MKVTHQLEASTIMFLAALSASAFAADKARPGITVYGLKAIGASQELATSLQEHLESKLLAYGAFDVLSRSDIDLILSENRLQQSGACTDEDCLVETGSLLGVEKMVTGTLSQVGLTYNLVLKLIDIRTARLEASASGRHTGTADRLLDVSDELLRKLLEPSVAALRPDTVTLVRTLTDTVTAVDTVTVRDTVWALAPDSTMRKEVTQPYDRLSTPPAALPEADPKRARKFAIGALAILGAMAAGLLTYQLVAR